MEELILSLQDEHISREDVVDCLRSFGQAAVEPLKRALENKANSLWVRAEAAALLPQLSQEKAIFDLLIAVIQDNSEEWRMRVYALKGLPNLAENERCYDEVQSSKHLF